MYGIITFARDGKSPSADFRALDTIQGKQLRLSACDRCRISRVRCSGRSQRSNCERCKRLKRVCSYTMTPKSAQNFKISEFETNPEATQKLPLSPQSSEGGANSLLEPPTYYSPDFSSTSINYEYLPEAFFGEHPEFNQNSQNSYLCVSEVCENIASSSSLEAGYDYASLTTQNDLVLPPNLEVEDYLADLDCALPTYGISYHMSSTENAREDCQCLQRLSSGLFMLNCGNGQELEPLAVDDFLDIFERAMIHLQAVQVCQYSCILSRDLAILLLMRIEQLSKLAMSLTKDVFNDDKAAAKALMYDRMFSSARLSQSDNQDGEKRGRRGSLASYIGEFKLSDPIDLLLVIRQLLRVRLRNFREFVSNLSKQMLNADVKDLKARFECIEEVLANCDRSDTLDSHLE